MNRYIAVKSEYGKFVAIHPSGMRLHFLYEEELEAIKQNWGIDTVIGDDLLKIQPRPPAA